MLYEAKMKVGPCFKIITPCAMCRQTPIIMELSRVCTELAHTDTYESEYKTINKCRTSVAIQITMGQANYAPMPGRLHLSIDTNHTMPCKCSAPARQQSFMCLHDARLNYKDIDNVLCNAGRFLLHIIQDLVVEAWARCMASVFTSAPFVTFHHFVVLLALCFLLVPIGIWASLVAHLVLATC